MRILAIVCMVLGIGGTVAWYVFVSPVLFMGESGPKGFRVRLLAASPLLISGGILLLAGWLDRRAATTPAQRKVVSTTSFICAALVGIAVLWIFTREW